MKDHQALALNVWYWPSLAALITCWQYKQFRTQLWLDRQDGVNEPYYTDYLTSVQWVMWSYNTLACLKHTSHVSPGMFAFQLQPRITSPQLRSDKNRCVIIALWAVSKVMQWHSRWEMFAELRVCIGLSELEARQGFWTACFLLCMLGISSSNTHLI